MLVEITRFTTAFYLSLTVSEATAQEASRLELLNHIERFFILAVFAIYPAFDNLKNSVISKSYHHRFR